MSVLLDRYELLLSNNSILINLGPGHKVLTNVSPEGEIQPIHSIGIGKVDADLTISADKNLKYSQAEMAFGITKVAAVCTADFSDGVCRAGIKSSTSKGEVSLIIIIEAAMTGSAMARAAITATETITALIQDLDVRAENGICGSFTGKINMAIITDNESKLTLRSAGKHSKLGELIGNVVYDAVRQSVIANGFAEDSQMDVITRLERMGFDIEKAISQNLPETNKMKEKLRMLLENPKYKVVFSSLLLLNDEILWGLIPENSGLTTGRKMIELVFEQSCEESNDLISCFIQTSIQKIKE